MIKRIFALILICIFYISAITVHALNEEYILSPKDEVTGDFMTVKVNLPDTSLGADFLIDDKTSYNLSDDLSGQTVSFDLPTDSMAYGRHYISLNIKTPEGMIKEEKIINIKGEGIPYIEDAAYKKGGERVWVSEWEEGEPSATRAGYVIKFSDAFSQISGKMYYLTASGKKVEVACDFSFSGEEVSIIPKRVPAVRGKYLIEFTDLEYDGGKVLKPIEFFFKPVELSNEKIFTVNDFEGGETLTSLKQSGGIIYNDKDDDGGGVLHFKSLEGEKCKSYADISVGDVGECESYVVDLKIKPINITGGAYLTLFDAQSSSGWEKGIKIDADLTPYKGSLDIADKPLMLNEWTRICALYNIGVETAIYIDGVKVYSYSKNETKPAAFRIDIVADGTDNIEFLVDDYMIYAAEEPKDEICFEDLPEISVMDSQNSILAAIGSGCVYSCVGDYYFAGGERKKYKTDGEKPLLCGEKAFVSAEFLSSVYGCVGEAENDTVTLGNMVFSADSEETFTRNGNLYISAEAVFSALQKNYLFDDRGFFIISDDEISLKNSAEIEKITEKADAVHRFVAFDNPRGEEILSDFLLKGTHPRILYTEDDLNYINQNLSDHDILAAKQRSVSRVQNVMGYQGLTPNPDKDEKKDQATSLQSVMNNLAEAYLLTNDSIYAEEGIRLMDIAVKWDSVTEGVSKLTIGHFAMSLAIGYDSFYNYLNATESGREKLSLYREAIKKLIFSDVLMAYRGQGGAKWIKMNDNFLGVCAGGVLSLVLAVADEEYFSDIMPYLIENVLNSCELAAALYYPDGGYYEGVGYSNYLLKNLTIAFEALFHCVNTDYGISNSKGFTEAGSFFAYMQTPMAAFNFSDMSQGAETSFIPYWFAYRYKNKDIAQLHFIQNKYRSYVHNMRDMYFYKRAMEGEAIDVSLIETDKYYHGIETGTFRSTFLSGTPTFAGFHAGRNGMAHDHLDVGQFIFESDYVRWACDLGNDSYSIPNYFSVPEGYSIYRKKTEGHNCLVINPDTEPDTYFGQEVDAVTELEALVSKPKGAYAIYNLTDAYKRDVSAYRRGYYFGDNRKTLTVRDELTLKNENSEIYWFMHTPAEIEILSENEAVLIYGARKLRAVLDTNAENALFLDMNPKSLEPDNVSGQALNSGRKLAVHIPEISGDVYISVKLIPFSAEGATWTEFPMLSEWAVPEGEIEKETLKVLKPLQNSHFREKDIPIEIYSSNAVPLVYFDNEEIEINDNGDGIYFGSVPYSEQNLGKHYITVIYGENKITREVNFFKTISQKREYTIQNLGNLSNGAVTLCEGSDGSENGGIRIEKEEKNAFYSLDINESGKTVFVEFDIKKENSEGAFNLEGKNSSSYVWLGEKNLLSLSGQIGNTDIFMPQNEWHNIRIVQNLSDKGIFEIYYDGKLIESKASEYDLSLLKTLKLHVTGGSICLDNIYFGEYVTDDDKDTVSDFKIEINGDSAVATAIVYRVQNSSLPENALFVLASYKGKEIVNISLKTVTLCGEIQNELEGLRGGEVKAFLWTKALGNILKK